MVCCGQVDQHKRDVEEVRRRDALLDATALWTGNGNWSRRSKQRMKLNFGDKMTDAGDGFGDQYYLVPA
jgi:hypothetical protein